MAVAILMHAGFVAFLLLPAGTWRWRGAVRSSMRSDGLLVRFIAMSKAIPSLPLPRAKASLHARSVTPVRHPSAPVVSPKPSLAMKADIPFLSAVDARGAPPSWIAGGGRFAADPGFARDNVHLPGSTQPVRGMPVFRMVDPKMQGLAGAVRAIGGLLGAVDSHCVDLDAWRNMTRSERIAHHVTDERMDDYAERYHCVPPESGAERYRR